jgi:hypothetical protein
VPGSNQLRSEQPATCPASHGPCQLTSAGILDLTRFGGHPNAWVEDCDVIGPTFRFPGDCGPAEMRMAVRAPSGLVGDTGLEPVTSRM